MNLIAIVLLLIAILFPSFYQQVIEPLSEISQSSKSVSDPVLGQQMILSEDFAIVTRVIDGDTVVLENGQKIRYIGIDTPETTDPSRPDGCFGEQAYLKNKELVENKNVRLEKDVSETDRYGRLLRYVYVDDLMINEFLVKEGYAQASSYPPDIKYQDLFKNAQDSAREKKIGLWGNTCNYSPAVSN